MSAIDYFDAYRRMVATADDSVVAWWYSGWTFLEAEGFPAVPLNQVMAVMTYRTETVSERQFRIHWSEIGVFRDPATSALPAQWTNPLTGRQVQTPQQFHEGPGMVTVTATTDGVALAIRQPNATLRSASVRFLERDGRLGIVQEERKLRGFPTVDGKLPPPGSPAGFEGITELSFFASTDALAARDPALQVQGAYTFTLLGFPPWMGCGELRGQTVTRGRITRAAPGEAVDALSWERLARLFPAEIKRPPALDARA